MKVSVITPTWNRAASLPGTFASVQAQGDLVAEHFVVDNLSTDATAEVVAHYAASAAYPVHHLREADGGLYEAMNKGVARARGEAVYCLNDDDRLLGPESLGVLVGLLEHTGAAFACADVQVRQADGRLRLRHHRQINRLTLAEKSICQQAILYRREAFRIHGGFDASLRFAADYDWTLRVLLQDGGRLACVRAVVAEFAEGGLSSAPAHRAAFEAEMEAVRRRYFSADDLRRARAYRRRWRKVPFGERLVSFAGPVRLPVCPRLHVLGRFWPDPLAWLGF